MRQKVPLSRRSRVSCQQIVSISFVPLPWTADSSQTHLAFRGHTDFAESTEEIAALSPEEKKKRLEELRERVKAKRAGQSEIEKEEQKRNEVCLRLYGYEGWNMLINIHIANQA